MTILDKIKFYYKEIGIKKLIIKIYFKLFEIIKKIFFFKKNLIKTIKRFLQRFTKIIIGEV